MTWLAFLLFCVGIALIVKGGDLFVDAASWVSDATGISKAVIGATIVSFATTSPEYFVSTIATVKGLNDFAVGNAVGSLICNIGLAFAVLAFFTSGKFKDSLFWVKGLFMILSTAVLWFFCADGVVSSGEGIILLLIFAAFTVFNIYTSKDGGDKKEREKPSRRNIAVNAAKFIFGAAGVVYGSSLIVDNGKIIASHFGVSDAVIGLTVVAVGTSLPEIATSVAAVIKKQNAISIGNILGANVLDATLILATGSFISSNGLAVSGRTANTDLPVALIFMLAAAVPSAIGKKLYKWQGLLLVLGYAAYLFYITILG